MKLIFALLVGLVIPHIAHAGGCPDTPVKIEKSIRHHIDKLGAAEYCDARRVKTEDGLTVAIYTAEGACADVDPHEKAGTCSNNWVRYLVALSGGRLTPPVEIGGKGALEDTNIEIREGIIEVSGLSAGPDDAMCCPSVAKTKKFKILGSRLSEVR